VTEAFRLNSAAIETEERKGYLYVRVHGELSTVADVERAVVHLRDRMDQAGTKKLHIDVRQLRIPLPDDACHAAWQFIHARDYTILACTLPEETGDMMVTRMNMTGLSASLPFRAFSNIVEAHRWLELRPSGVRRVSSVSIPAVSPPTSLSQQIGAVRSVSTGTSQTIAPASSTSETTPPPPSPRKKPPTIPPAR
jgi:hypothetical protein